MPGKLVSEHPYVNPTTGQPDLVVFRCETPEGKSYRPCRPVAGGWAFGQCAKPWPLYRRHAVQRCDRVVVVEGERCADILARFGIAATTSAFGAGKGEHSDWSPLSGKLCVLWPDHDEPGQRHMEQVREILLQLSPPCRVTRIDPEALGLGAKQDLADLVSAFEGMGWDESAVKTELARILQEARPVGPLGRLADRIEAIVAGRYQVIKWPTWPVLGNLTKALLPGAVAILAGTPGASKSLMLVQAVAGWINVGCPVALYELEGDKEYHLARVLAQRAGISGLTDPAWIRENPEQARAALAKHGDFLERVARHLWTTETLAAETLEQLAHWVEQQAKAHRRIIGLDPITAGARTDKVWISDLSFLKAIKRTAMQHGCSVVLISHPVKGQIDPSLGTLAGSAAFERFTDCVLTIHAHEARQSTVRGVYGTTCEEHNRTLRIEKARNGPGTGCRVAYRFDRDNLRIAELGLIVSSKGSQDARRQDRIE